MTTFIDDGLVESCLDEPNPVIDLDQINIIDEDNINAVIEDPGYILEDAPNNLNQKEVYTSSYRKRSSTLPVTFFDISRNIRLLKRCRPISIKVVDCDIYPWYYKRNNSDLKQQFKRTKESNAYEVTYNITEISNSTSYDTELKDQVCTISRITSPRINLSSEQRATVLKLKEGIENEIYANKASKDIFEGLDNNKSTLNFENMLSNDKKIAESRLNKNIEDYELLAYKEIARTIVRNIDNNKTENLIRNAITNHNSEKTHRKKNYGKKVQSENISTSPILSCSVSKKKNTKPKEKMLGKTPKANKNLKKCSKIMSTIDQLIPHYHWPVPPNNNNNMSSISNFANYIHLQEPLNNFPFFNGQQNCTESDVFLSNSNSIPGDNCRGRLNTYTNSNDLCIDCPVSSSLATRGQFYETGNPNFPRLISDRQLHYPSLLHYQNTLHPASKYPNQPNAMNRSSLRLVRRPRIKQVSKENFRVYSQASNIGKKLQDNIPNSNLLNNNVNYSTAQIPLHRTASQFNPLLSHFLNCNKQIEYHQPVLEQQGYLDPRSVMERTSVPSTTQHFWLPPRPLPPPCSFEYNYSLTPFAQDENFLYPNSGTHLQCFPSVDNTHVSHHKTNLNHRNLDLTPNEPTRDLNNIKNIPVDPPNVTITMSPKIDSINHNSRIEMQNMPQVTYDSYGVTNPKVTIDNRLKVVKVFAKPGKTSDDKTGNIESKTVGYSPPILPIPSFKRSLEILSELKNSPIKQCNTSDLRKNQEISNIIRKRKLTEDEKNCINSKRISLEEYKLRRSENVIRIM